MIDNSTRVFIAVVDPQGIFGMGIDRNCFFTLYKEMHPALSEEVFSRNINVTFMKIDGFESKRNLEKFFLFSMILMKTSIMQMSF